MLVRRGILASVKGPGGGLILSRPAADIKAIEVVEAIDGLGFTTQCVLGIPNCNDDAPCPLHARWGAIRCEIRNMLEQDSVLALSNLLKSEQSVLTRR